MFGSHSGSMEIHTATVIWETELRAASKMSLSYKVRTEQKSKRLLSDVSLYLPALARFESGGRRFTTRYHHHRWVSHAGIISHPQICRETMTSEILPHTSIVKV